MAPRDTINLILLALGLSILIWLVSLLARFRRGRAHRDATNGVQRVSQIPGENAGSTQGEKALLVLGVGMLGAISGSCLAYFIIKGMDVDGWEELPAPPQPATAILYVRAECESENFDVFVQSENGTLYSCSHVGRICSPSEYSAKQIAEMAASAPYFDAEPGDYPPPPRSRIVDICKFSGVPSCEVISTVALLEDGSLWFKPGAPYDVAGVIGCLAFPLGACAGGIGGVVVGAALVWRQGHTLRKRKERSRAEGTG